MDITPIEKAIRLRLLADTGSGGLFASGATLINGVYNTAAPSTATPPYIVYQITGAERDDAFEGAIRVVTVDVDVFVPYQSTSSGLSDPIKRGGQILARIDGNWWTTATRVPSYGLERHKLTLSNTSWTADILEGVTTTANHEPGMFVWTDTYRTLVSIASP